MTRSDAPPLAGRTILVVGPGWLGGTVAEQLQQAGARVFTMQRSVPASPQRATADAAFPIVAIEGDISVAATSPSVLDALPRAIDHLVLCVAPSRSRGDTHSSSYPAAARGAIALALALGARSALYTSSTGVYGRTAGEEVDELTTLHPEDERQQALVDAERDFWNGAASSELGAIVLRVAGLYGPGRDPGRRFGDPATVADGGETWSNFSWRDDVADAVLHLLADTRFAQGAHCFNCTDGHPLQARTIAQALGVNVGALQRDTATERLSANTVGQATASVRTRKSNQRISIARLLATGWAPRVPTVFDGLELLGHRVTRPAEAT